MHLTSRSTCGLLGNGGVHDHFGRPFLGRVHDQPLQRVLLSAQEYQVQVHFAYVCLVTVWHLLPTDSDFTTV